MSKRTKRKFAAAMLEAYCHAGRKRDLREQFKADLIEDFIFMVWGVGGVLLLYSLILVANNAKIIDSAILFRLGSFVPPSSSDPFHPSNESGIMGFFWLFLDPVVFWCYGAFPAGLWLIAGSTGFATLANLAGEYSAAMYAIGFGFAFVCAIPIILFLMLSYLVGAFFLSVLYFAGLLAGVAVFGMIAPTPLCAILFVVD